MFYRKKNKPRERFYLFPGQGGSNYRLKQQLIMRWTLAAAVLGAAAVAAILWWLRDPDRTALDQTSTVVTMLKIR